MHMLPAFATSFRLFDAWFSLVLVQKSDKLVKELHEKEGKAMALVTKHEKDVETEERVIRAARKILVHMEKDIGVRFQPQKGPRGPIPAGRGR